MRISTDPIILGSWAVVDKAKTILDVGTGTGIIALMLAQRSTAKIDAIDIDEQCVRQAKLNFQRSKWDKRLNVYQVGLQNFHSEKPYDIIISNPPYFPLPETQLSKADAKARYTHTLSFEDLADHVKRLLDPDGFFYVIFPVHEGAYFTNIAEKRKLFLNEYLWIKTSSRKKFPKRILMSFSLKRRNIESDELMVIQDDHGYTEQYKALTGDFYLKF